jgi:hypothetical protein
MLRTTIAEACEEILLSSGLHEEAYRRHALLSLGRGYEITSFEVQEAYAAMMQAARAAGCDEERIRADIGKLIEGAGRDGQLLRRALTHHFPE